MLEPEYGPVVAEVLDQIEGDAGRRELWDAVQDAIDLVCDLPDSREARMRAIRVYDDPSREPYTVYGVDVRTREENWILLWRPDKGLDGDDVALFVYLGDYTIPH